MEMEKSRPTRTKRTPARIQRKGICAAVKKKKAREQKDEAAAAAHAQPNARAHLGPVQEDVGNVRADQRVDCSRRAA